MEYNKESSHIDNSFINNQNNTNSTNKKHSGKKIELGILLITIIICVVIVILSILKTVNDEKTVAKEMLALKDNITISALGYEFDTPFDKNKFEYTLNIDAKKVQIQCSNKERVKGCNEIIDLGDKDKYDHVIKYKSLDEQEYTYTIHINKKEEDQNIELDSLIVSNASVSNENNIIIVDAKSKNGEKLQYSFDGGVNWQDSNEYEITENEEISVIIKDETGNEIKKEIKVETIDKIPPTVILTVKERTNNKIIIYAEAYDNSGQIIGYNWNDKGYTIESEYEITKEGIYTVKVKDEAGNESEEVSIEIPKSEFTEEEVKIERTYTVKIEGNGAEVAQKTVTCKTTDIQCEVNLPKITRNGYQILGYSKNKDSDSFIYESNSKIKITGDMTLYAITRKELNIKYERNGTRLKGGKSSCYIHNTQKTCNIKTPIIEKEGWKGLGFALNGDSHDIKYGSNTTIKISENMTLYAITSKKVSIKFEKNGATDIGNESYGCYMHNNQTNCSITMPSITRKDFEIIGWSEDKDATDKKYKVKETINFNSDKTLYAITKKKVSINFQKNGATDIGKTIEECYIYNNQKDCNITMPNITKKDFEIIGWSEDKNLTDTKETDKYYKVGNSKAMDSNKTLYAITRKKVSIKFEKNGATDIGNESYGCYMYNNQTNCSITMPSITRSGYEIIGWAENKDATDKKYKVKETINFNSDKTLYAITKKQVTITFNKNEATSINGSTANSVKLKCTITNSATSCDIKSPVIKSSYTIVGYNTNKNATTSTWNQNTTKKVANDETYYAIVKYTELIITVPDVKTEVKGDCVLLKSKGKYLLMDTCYHDDNNGLINYLTNNGIKNLDIYISHYHNDHYGELLKILKNNNIKIGKLYLPNKTHFYTTDQSILSNQNYTTLSNTITDFDRIVKASNEKGVKIVYLKEGDSFNIGDANVKIIYSPTNVFDKTKLTNEASLSYLNNSSLVAIVTVGNIKYLTAGDIEKDIENKILSKNIKADIMKLSHHGANTSNTKAFIDKVSPQYAFYCSSYTSEKNNVFSNGGVDQTRKILESKKIPVYSSGSRGYNGEVVITIKDDSITVKKAKH